MMQACMDYHRIIHRDLHSHTIVMNQPQPQKRDLGFLKVKECYLKQQNKTHSC